MFCRSISQANTDASYDCRVTDNTLHPNNVNRVNAIVPDQTNTYSKIRCHKLISQKSDVMDTIKVDEKTSMWRLHGGHRRLRLLKKMRSLLPRLIEPLATGHKACAKFAGAGQGINDVPPLFLGVRRQSRIDPPLSYGLLHE